MQIQVESDASHCGAEMPRRFHLARRQVEVVENLDQWQGSDYRYFKVKGDDGNLYVLRLDESRADWELTMFQRPRAEAMSMQFHAKKQLRSADTM